MVEKIDISTIFTEIDEAIKIDDHEKVLSLSDKILKVDAKDKEAFQCKVIALINLSRNDELISILEKQGLVKDYLLEYAYALHDKKKYSESINILNQHASSRKDIAAGINELIAQNYYRQNAYQDSCRIYKELVQNQLKSNQGLEEDKDLVSNYLASCILSDLKESELILGLTKHLNSWESFYNYCIIFLKNGKFEDAMDILARYKDEYSAQELDYNEFKALNLDLSILQKSLDGFDIIKVTNIQEEYEKYFSKNKFPELYPYFYNNYLHAKKDKDSVTEIIKKFDNFLKSESLSNDEKKTLTLNKVIFLLRANRSIEAKELFKTLKVDYDSPKYVITLCFLTFKQEKIEKLEEVINTDKELKNRPESHIVLLQLMLSTISSKTIEQFHIKVISFVKQFFSYTLNYNFLSFFIGVYESRHLKDYLKDFLSNYKETSIFSKIEDRKILKKCFNLLGSAFLKAGLFEEGIKYYTYIVEKIDKNDREVNLNLISALAHIDTKRSAEYRKQVDDTRVDISLDHINSLLNEVFGKFKLNEEKTKKTKKKKRKIIYPKNFDPKKPGPMPDPERWIPKLQRKKYRNITKNKMAYQGAQTDNITTTSSKK
jgi:signal recognition particle subunit SRP72